MPDAILIASIVSAAMALPALAMAVWHACKLEQHRRRPPRARPPRR